MMMTLDQFEFGIVGPGYLDLPLAAESDLSR
jgi:hypothetical protein